MQPNPYLINPNLLSTLYMQQQQSQMKFPQFLQKGSKDTYVCKFYFDNQDERRRVNISKDINYDGLLLFVENYIRPFGKNEKIHKMQYMDDEKEWINFSSNTEWKDCLEQVKAMNLNIVKVKVVTKKKSKKGKKEKKKTPETKEVKKTTEKVEKIVEKVEILEEEPKKKQIPTHLKPILQNLVKEEKPVEEIVQIKKKAIHQQIRCDKCGKDPIDGTRYRAIDVNNYDLCEDCFNQRATFGMEKTGFEVMHEPDVVAKIIPSIQKMNQTTVPKTYPTVPENVVVPMAVSVSEGIKQNQDKINENKDDIEASDDFKNKIVLLKEMGFHDSKKSLALLKETKGDLQAVVRKYLSV